MQAFYRVSHAILGTLIRVAWRVRSTGRENVPRAGRVILASNHLSFLDHFVTGAAVSRQLFFISKVQHFDSRLKAFFFRRWGVIPLRRGEGDQVAFDRSLEVLRADGAFIIYPEGTRSLDGKLHRGHSGVARLALMTGSPVVPVACLGTFENLPKGRSWPRFGRVEVRFGRPLDFSRFARKVEDRDVLRRITDTVMREIQALSGQEFVNAYQENPEYRPTTGTKAPGRASRGRSPPARRSPGRKAARRSRAEATP